MSDILQEKFDTLSGYRTLLTRLLQQAKQRIEWFAPDFAECKAGSNEVASALQQLLASSRTAHIRLLLHDSTHLAQQCPRLLPILTQYSNTFSVRLTDDAHRNQAHCFLIGDDLIVRRFHRDHPRGAADSDGRLLSQYHLQFEQMWETGQPCTDWQRLHL